MAVEASEAAELVTDPMAASRTEAAWVSRAVDRLPSIVALAEDADVCLTFTSFEGDAFPSASSGTAPSADTAADPMFSTALPRKLIADAPVLIRIDDAVCPCSGSGGGGRGNSLCFVHALVASIFSSALRSDSPRFGRSSAALIEAGEVGAGGVIGLGGGSF